MRDIAFWKKKIEQRESELKFLSERGMGGRWKRIPRHPSQYVRVPPKKRLMGPRLWGLRRLMWVRALKEAIYYHGRIKMLNAKIEFYKERIEALLPRCERILKSPVI